MPDLPGATSKLRGCSKIPEGEQEKNQPPKTSGSDRQNEIHPRKRVTALRFDFVVAGLGAFAGTTRNGLFVIIDGKAPIDLFYEHLAHLHSEFFGNQSFERLGYCHPTLAQKTEVFLYDI